MNRSIVYSGEQIRSFDLMWQNKDIVTALGYAVSDLLGSNATAIAGFIASSNSSLVVSLTSGRIYQNTAIDSAAYGVLPADSTLVTQQGFAALQNITLSTSGLASGQSQWVLLEVQYQQVDVIRATDPSSGILPYVNAANSQQPLQGLNDGGVAQNTERTGIASVNVIYGTAATTGSEVPPTPTSGYVPMYLIDLAYGQTSITQSEIIVAGPAVGLNVPSTYPSAPFISRSIFHPFIPFYATGSLSISQSGVYVNTDGFSAAGTITVPAASTINLFYRIYGNSGYAVTVNTAGGSIRLSNGALVASYVLPLDSGAYIEMAADGSNYRARTSVITGGDIAGATIAGTNIIPGTLTGNLIATDTVQGTSLVNSTVTETQLAGGSVHQGQLSTATASGGINIGSNNGGTYSLIGGPYALWTPSATGVTQSSTGAATNWIAFGSGGAQGLGVIGISNNEGYDGSNTSESFYIAELYINSSPPYSEGPLFIYMGFNKAGERTHICVAPDPSWAHHGPTILIPHYKDKTGMGWRRIRSIDGTPCHVIARDPAHKLFGAYLAGDGIEEVPVKIDLAYKDSDRDAEPHPWHHTPLPDTQFCLLEPGSDLMVQLHQIYLDTDADSVRKIVEEHLNVGDVIDKNAPKGMVIRTAQWIKTRK